MLDHRLFGDKVVDWLNVVLLTLIGASMLFPFYYMTVVSFASLTDYLQSDLLLWPKRWVIESYVYILHSPSFIRSLGVTSYVAVLGTFCNLLFTAAMAYGLTKKIIGQKFFMGMVLFTFVFGAGLIPNYLIVKETGLIDTYWSLIIPGLIDGFQLIVFRQFFMELPAELSESAMIDGANEMQIFYKIILPLSKPVLAAFALFTAVDYWNIYFTPILYLNDPDKWTIQVLLRQLVILDTGLAALKNSEEMLIKHPPPPETVGMAAVMIATVPILIVYPFLQKYFSKGVMLGAIKG